MLLKIVPGTCQCLRHTSAVPLFPLWGKRFPGDKLGERRRGGLGGWARGELATDRGRVGESVMDERAAAHGHVLRQGLSFSEGR